MSFQTFYAMYPRKMGRKEAEKAWNRLTPIQQAECLEALPNYLKYWKLKETQKDYIPYPASFLNQERWTDELDLEPNKKPELPWYSTEELTTRKAQEVGCRHLLLRHSLLACGCKTGRKSKHVAPVVEMWPGMCSGCFVAACISCPDVGAPCVIGSIHSQQ